MPTSERQKITNKKWRDRHPEQDKAIHKTYREKYPERIREANRKCRERKPEKYKAIGKAWRKANRERVNATVKRYRGRYPERIKLAAKLRHKRVAECARIRRHLLRVQVIEKYGSICKCCGESEIDFLSIDHINGGGTQHRKKIGLAAMYQWLRRHNFPEGFQVLCMNCNWGRSRNGGNCPHESKKDCI